MHRLTDVTVSAFTAKEIQTETENGVDQPAPILISDDWQPASDAET